MLHGRVRKILSAYLDGELGEREKRLVEAHLKKCEQCLEELKALRAVDRITRARVSPEPPEAYWKTLPSRVRTRLIVEGEASRARALRGLFVLKPPRLTLVATLAAAALVVVVSRHYLIEERPEFMRMGKLPEEESPTDAKPGEMELRPPKPGAELGAEPKASMGEGTRKPMMREKERAKGAMGVEKMQVQAPESAPSLPESKEGAAVRAGEPGQGEGISLYEAREVTQPMARDKTEGTEPLPEGEELVSISSRYELALSQQKRGEYEEALRNYSLVTAKDEKLAPSAQYQINLIQASVKDTGSDEESLRRKIEMWESYVDQYPKSELVPDAYRNLADNAYRLSKLTQRRDDIEEAIAASRKYLEFAKERRMAEYYGRQLDDLKRDLDRLE